MEKEKTLIEQKYDALFEKDKNWKALDEKSFLNALINLESAWKRKLFRTLLGDKTKEEVREYLQTKSREDWEKIVWKDYLGKKMTISDVIDQYSKMVKNVFKSKPIKKAIKEQYECRQVDGMILPPEWQQRLVSWWGSEWWDDEEKKTLKFKQYQDKSPVLCWDILTVENGIFPWDIVFFEWENEKNALRYTWYVALQIPKLNKTIFINDMKWEATFVCDQLVSQEDMKKSKKRLSKQLWEAFHSVNYLEDKKELWKLDMLDLIFWPEKWSRKIVREALIDKNGELTEKWKEWFSTKPNMNDRGTFKLFNRMWYHRITWIFWIKWKKNDLIKDLSFYKLNVAIFWEENPNVKNLKKLLMTPEEIKTEIFQRQDEWFNILGGKTRKPFKLSNWMGYKRFGKKFWIKVDGQLNLKQFYDLSVAIFWENHPKVKKLKTKIDKINTNYEEIKTEIFQRQDERFKLNNGNGKNSRKRFKLSKWIGYFRIAWMFWMEGTQTELKKDPAFYDLSVAIFWENHPKVKELKIRLDKKKINLDKIISEIHDRENEWFRLDCSKWNHRRNFMLSDWIGYCRIAWIFWVKRNTYNDLYKDDAFYDLSVAIFWEEDPNVKNLKKLLMTPEEIRTELFQRQDERFKLNTNDDCRSFKLSNGKWYVALARLFWLQGPENDLFKDGAFYELSAAIFWEENENVKKLKEKSDKSK